MNQYTQILTRPSKMYFLKDYPTYTCGSSIILGENNQEKAYLRLLIMVNLTGLHTFLAKLTKEV